MESSATEALASALGVDEHGGPGDLLDRVRKMRTDLQIANRAISGDLACKVMAVTDKLCAALAWDSDGTGRQLESAAQAMVELLDERNKLVPVVFDAVTDKLCGVLGWTTDKARAVGISGAVDQVVLSMAELGLALDPVNDGGSDVTARTIGDHRETAARAVAELLQLRAERARVDLLQLRAERLRSHVNVVRVIQHASGIRERRFNVRTTLSAQDRRVFDDLNKAVDDLSAEQNNNAGPRDRQVFDDLNNRHRAYTKEATDAHAKCRMDLVKISAALGTRDTNIATILDVITRMKETNATLNSEQSSALATERKAHAETLAKLEEARSGLEIERRAHAVASGMAESAEAVISGANAAVAEFLAARP